MDEASGPVDWDRIEHIFLQARAQPPTERRAFVRMMADGDPSIAGIVDDLLQNDLEDGFLEPPGDDTLLGHLAEAQAPPADLTGCLLFGQYELGALIGRGGTGAVYAGRDRFRNEPVAVKVLARKRGEGDRGARFELASLRLLRLPGVVDLLDDGYDDELGMCVVMRLVAGRPFGPTLGPWPWSRVRRTTGALLETLARIHARGMVHRDLKPANVLVDEQGLPTVLDLGISGVAGPGASARAHLIGTPAYMAPEVAKGELPDERADLHAVGLMAYEALTGTKRYDAGHTPTILHEKQELTREQVRSWLDDAGLPDEARLLLGGLLAPSPFERPQSARAAYALLEPPSAGVRHPAVAAGSEDGLAAIFVGHERLFHVPSDAAHELWRRTHGDPADVQEELDAWERARLGRWEPDGFHITRDAIEDLRAGLHPRVPAEVPETPPGARQIVPYVRVLPAPVLPGVLAHAARITAEEAVAQLALLEAEGILAEAEGGAFALTPRGLALPVPELAADYAGRLANAWPAGLPGRLELLIRAGRDAEVPAETIYAARHAFQSASLSACVRVCELGLRTNPPPGTEHALLAVLLRASIPQSSRAALERALMLVERSSLSDAQRAPLERIARAALLMLTGRPARAWATLPEDPQGYTDEVLVVLDEMVRNFMLRSLPLDEQEARIRDLYGPPGAAHRLAPLSAWAWLRLLQSRFEDAATLFDRQLALAPNEGARISILANVLYVRMLLFRLDEAEVIAEELRAAARTRRMPRVQAQVEHNLRSIPYMRGDPASPDEELLDAIRALGHDRFTRRVLLQEAAIAWRADAPALAAQCLAEACEPAFAGDADADVDPLARAFYAYLAPERSPDTRAVLTALLEQADTASDTVQMIALMAMRDAAWAAGLSDRFETALAAVPQETWRYRREVLSITECMDAVKSPPAKSQG